MINKEIKESFFQEGYCVLRNILNDKEIEELNLTIDQELKEKNISKINNFSEHELFWPYIANEKILNCLNELLNEKIFFMDGGFSNYNTNSEDTNNHKISWHRDTDSAPKIKNEVPYCEKNNYYKVFTVMTYLNKGLKNQISIIPKTHKVEYKKTLSNILRIIHWKTKNKKKISFIRKFIEKNIAKKIIINPGDCLVFFVGLFHKPVAPVNSGYRKAIITRYAPKGKNSENYINYILKNSSRLHYSDKKFLNYKNSDSFVDFLKKKNIFY